MELDGSECTVFEELMRWIEFHPRGRRGRAVYLSDVLPHFRTA